MFDGFDVYGPCPGCDNWSLQAPALEDGAVVDAILWEHADECPWLEALAIVMDRRR